MKKLIFGVVAFCVLLSGTTFAITDQSQLVLKEADNKPLKSVTLPGGRTPPGVITDECFLIETGPTAYTFGPFSGNGDQFLIYQDPTACTPNPYPYQVSDMSFALLNYDPAGQQSVDMIAHVYNADLSDPQCPVPGALLCSTPLFNIVFQPGEGLIISAPFSDICCVNGPFFVGLELPSDQYQGISIFITDPALPSMACHCYYGFGAGWFDFTTSLGTFNLSDYNYSHGWAAGQNECGDVEWSNHKMHYPQLPDPNGWDVSATEPFCLADDWECSETGYIQDLHWWGSWRHDDIGQIIGFIVSIHNNIPIGPGGYSQPGDPLWGPMEITDFTEVPMEPSPQGWYDPASGEVFPQGDHNQYFRYDVLLQEPDWIWQNQGEIYWLRVSAIVVDPGFTQWGWKSTQDHFMDDAVWAPDPWDPIPPWIEIYEPGGGPPPEPLLNDFYVMFDPEGNFMDGMGFDTPYPDFYFYELFGWWNVWFYDHPLDFSRKKQFVVDGWITPMAPSLPASIEIAINWSTDQWPPGGPPPLPDLFPFPEEEVFIGRQTIFQIDLPQGFVEPIQVNEFFEWLPYNPEWVSIDVRGANFMFEGTIEHTCMPREGGQQSLDLSFVITGGEPVETGACCWPEDGSCTQETEQICLDNGGQFMGYVDCADVECPQANIPTMSEWGMLILALLLMTAGTLAVVRRRRREATARA
ncbi:MAG: IPTL-CTERM sorting domain-containing protein [candidate division Zixibacteria bacterium]